MSYLGALIEDPEKEKVSFDSQEDDETIYFLLRRHPITNLRWILLSTAFVILPTIAMIMAKTYMSDPFLIIPAKYQLVVMIMWYLTIMFFTFDAFLIWYFNVYIITNKRVIDVDFRGLWFKRISEAPITSVQDVTFGTHKFWQILFDYGDIFMQTAAARSEFEFRSIPKPEMVHDKLTDIVEKYKNTHGHSN